MATCSFTLGIAGPSPNAVVCETGFKNSDVILKSCSFPTTLEPSVIVIFPSVPLGMQGSFSSSSTEGVGYLAKVSGRERLTSVDKLDMT